MRLVTLHVLNNDPVKMKSNYESVVLSRRCGTGLWTGCLWHSIIYLQSNSAIQPSLNDTSLCFTYVYINS